MSGKGSAPRPMPDYEKYSDNYDLIFRKKDDKNSPSPKCTLAQVGNSEKEKDKKST